MTRGTTKAHIARAALEAMAYQTADVIDVMQSAGGIRLRELRVDGGAAANDLLLQFQADVLGIPVVRPTVAETTALGAAYAAGLAVGFWRDLDELRANWQEGARWSPEWTDDQRAAGYAGWQKAVQRTLDWVDIS